jgi:TRAP-type C4-dicarboxylate transport system permease small subunit
LQISNDTTVGLDGEVEAEVDNHDFSGRVLNAAAVALAVFSGVTIVALIAMALVSIVGLQLFSRPVQGSVEIMQMGIAICGAAFFPICEIGDHNIKVEAFTNWLPAGVRRALDSVGHVMLTIVFALLTWRTSVAAYQLTQTHEVSTLLSVPLWIPTALMVPSLALTVLCAAYRAVGLFRARKQTS